MRSIWQRASETAPPVPFGYPNGKAYALNLWDNVIFTTTSQGCAGNPNQMWAMNLNDPQKKVMTFNPGSGGLWGRTGAAIDSNGVAWAPTGDGTYDLATRRYGNGLIGARVEGNELKLKDWYIPSNWAWLLQERPGHAGHSRHLQVQGKGIDGHRQQGMPPLSARSQVRRRRRSSDASLSHASDLQ